MLRGLLIAVIAVSALNAEIWNEAPKKYVPGTEYEYIYDAQILSGIPTTSWHYTGYRLLAKVRLLVKEMTEITLRLENVEFLKINSRINENEPTVFLPRDLFEEMEVDEVKELIKNHLQRPMQFQWTNGVVRGLRVDKEDTFWSINMKKGLLNMLNMDLTPTKTEDRTKWNGNYVHSRVEEGIEGMCNSIYHWNRLPILHVDQQYHNNKDNVAMTMTKTRNLIDCVEKPVFEHALFLSENCDAARVNVTRDVIKSEATTHMNLTYWTNKKDFFAWNVKSDARYTFAPVDAKVGSMSTFVKQNLTFVSEKTIEGQQQGVDTTNMIGEETLQMTVPIPEIAREKMESEFLTKKVFDLLNEIRPMIRERNTKVLTLIRDLVSLLRQSPKTIIEKVHRECQQQASEHPEVMDMFHDILPTIATKEAVEVIVEQAILKVQDRVEDDSEVARRVRMLGFMNNVVHEDLIITLLKVLKNPTLIKKTQRKETLKALLLTIGTLTKTYVHQRRVNSNMEFLQESTEGKNIEEEVLKVLRDLLLNKEAIPILKKDEQTIVVLKAIGNSGIKKAFTLITDVIYSDKVSTSVRVAAIYSLRHLAPLMQREVREWVLPLFFDVTKDAEVRIASFVIAMKTRPTRIVLDSLVDVIRRDPITQVRSFALSYLRNLANTMDACQNDIVHNITRVLETVDTKDFGMQYSHSYGIPLTESSKAVLHTNVIWTPEDFLPREIHMNLLAQNSGKNVQLMEIYLRTEGLQNLLTKMLGPNGRLYTIKDIQSLLKEIDLNENQMEVDNRFSLGMKIFGEDMGYWALNENLRSVIQQGFLGMSKNYMQFLQGKSPMPLNWRRASYLDAIVRIPTTFGLPFTANLTSVIYAQIDGQVKLIKGITDKEMIHAQIQVNPLLFSEHTVEAGIDATITKAFTQFKLETHIPQISNNNKWTLDMIYNKQGNKQLRFFINKPIQQSQEFPLIQIKTTLRNHLMQVKPSQGEWIIQSEPITAKFMQRKPEIKPITRQFSSQFLAMKFQLTFVKPQAYYVSRYPIPFHLMGDYMLELKVQNLANKPEEGIELRFITLGQPSQQPETTTQNNKFSMKVQLLRTTLQTTTTTPESETETSSSDMWNRNPKFRQSQGDEQMIEMRFDAEQTEERRVKFQILLDLMKIINERFTLQGELKMPTAVSFDIKNPLKINFEENREPRLNLEVTLKNKDEKEWMKYKMTVDMDDVALDIFRKMIENLEDYRAVHPFVEQCNKDIKNNYVNTPACFFVWRIVNMYNRWNHTFVVDDKAPLPLKAFMRLTMMTPLLRLRQCVGMIFPEFSDKLIDQQPGDENDLVFHKSFVASPFHAGVMSLNFVFDNIRVRFPRVVMPNYWLTHLHPSQEPMIKNFLREMTEGNYPATCNIRRVKTGKYQVRTFDGFLYENTMPTEVPTGRFILMQDINNTIQVSSYYKSGSKIIQIAARDMKHIHIIRPFNGEEMTVLVDGKTTELPLIVKNDNGKVILVIKLLTQNTYGIDNLLMVHMPILGLTLKTDCISMTDIEASPFYHTALRGFCGNFDGETNMELKTRDCRGYFVHPQEIVQSNEYVLTDVKENQSTTDVNSFVQRYHREHQDVFIPLKVCRRGERLIPFVVTNTRTQY